MGSDRAKPINCASIQPRALYSADAKIPVILIFDTARIAKCEVTVLASAPVQEIGACINPLNENSLTRYRSIRPLKNQTPFDRIMCAHISGDSLVDADIEDGDLAVLKLNFEESQVTQGRLVVLNCPAGVLVKFIYTDFDGEIRLVSRNKDFPDLVYGWGQVTIEALVMPIGRPTGLS